MKCSTEAHRPAKEAGKQKEAAPLMEKTCRCSCASTAQIMPLPPNQPASSLQLYS